MPLADTDSRILRYYDAMKTERALRCLTFTAALLASACTGEPAPLTQEQAGPPPQVPALPDEAHLLPAHKQPLPLTECDPYRSVVFIIGDRIFFEFDSATLRPDAIDHIERLAAYLKCFPDKHFMIEGHTDSRGSHKYNLELGCQRAKAAERAFIEHGLPVERMRTISYGADRPSHLGDNEEAWSQNRRVVFLVIEKLRESNCGE